MRIFREKQIVPICILVAMLFCSCEGGRRHSSRKSEESSTDKTESSEVQETRRAGHPLELKLYMERSGSMVSFDTDRSSGEFKGIVSTLLNRFPSIGNDDSTSVYIVNDNIYPYNGSVRDFLSNRNFFDATKGLGDPSYTDFDRIFSMILSDMKKYQVSALVSDLIYSAKGQESVSAGKLLNEAYALTHNTFKNNTYTSVILLKFSAGYYGPYYPFNSPSKGVQYSGDRPFYIMLFVSKESLYELYNSAEYQAFTKFSTISNFEDMFCFTDISFKPEFSIIPDYDHEGRFRKERTHGSSAVSGICEAQLSKDGEISVPIAVNLSGIPLSESYKKNKNLYNVNSTSGFHISSIKSIANVDDAEKVLAYLPGATHLIIVESDEKPKNETVGIQLEYRLPSWIAESSTGDDSNLTSEEFESTTFGLEEMMKGIFAAYMPDGSRHTVFDIEFTIKKK